MSFVNRMLASISKTSQKKKAPNQKNRPSPFVSKKLASIAESKKDQSEPASDKAAPPVADKPEIHSGNVDPIFEPVSKIEKSKKPGEPTPPVQLEPAPLLAPSVEKKVERLTKPAEKLETVTKPTEKATKLTEKPEKITNIKKTENCTNTEKTEMATKSTEKTEKAAKPIEKPEQATKATENPEKVTKPTEELETATKSAEKAFKPTKKPETVTKISETVEKVTKPIEKPAKASKPSENQQKLTKPSEKPEKVAKLADKLVAKIVEKIEKIIKPSEVKPEVKPEKSNVKHIAEKEIEPEKSEPKLDETTPKVSKLPELEPEESKLPELAPEESKLPELIPEVSKLPELVPEVSKLPELIPEVSKLPELKPEVSELSEIDPEVSKLPKLQPEVSKLPEFKPEESKLPELKLKISESPALTSQAATVEISTIHDAKLVPQNLPGHKEETSKDSDHQTESSDQLDSVPELSKFSNLNTELVKVSDPKPETSKVSDPNPELSKVSDPNPETSKVSDPKPVASKVLDSKTLTASDPKPETSKPTSAPLEDDPTANESSLISPQPISVVGDGVVKACKVNLEKLTKEQVQVQVQKIVEPTENGPAKLELINVPKAANIRPILDGVKLKESKIVEEKINLSEPPIKPVNSLEQQLDKPKLVEDCELDENSITDHNKIEPASKPETAKPEVPETDNNLAPKVSIFSTNAEKRKMPNLPCNDQPPLKLIKCIESTIDPLDFFMKKIPAKPAKAAVDSIQSIKTPVASIPVTSTPVSSTPVSSTPVTSTLVTSTPIDKSSVPSIDNTPTMPVNNAVTVKPAEPAEEVKEPSNDEDDIPLDALVVKSNDLCKPTTPPMSQMISARPVSPLQLVDKMAFPVSMESSTPPPPSMEVATLMNSNSVVPQPSIDPESNPLDLIFGRSNEPFFDASDIFGNSDANPLDDLFGLTPSNVPPLPVVPPIISHRAPDSISPVDGVLSMQSNSQSTTSSVEGLEDLFEDINKDINKAKMIQQQQQQHHHTPLPNNWINSVPVDLTVDTGLSNHSPVDNLFSSMAPMFNDQGPIIKSEPLSQNHDFPSIFPPAPPLTLPPSSATTLSVGSKTLDVDKILDQPIVQKAQELLQQQQQLNSQNKQRRSLTSPKLEPKAKATRRRRQSVTQRKKSITKASGPAMDLSSTTLAGLLKNRSPMLSPSHNTSGSTSGHIAALASNIGMSNLASQINKTKPATTSAPAPSDPPSSQTAPLSNPIFNQVIANMIQQQHRAQKPPTAEDIQRQARMILEQSKLNSVNKAQLTPPSAQSLQSLLATTTAPTPTATTPSSTSQPAPNLHGNNPFWGGLRNIFNNDNAPLLAKIKQEEGAATTKPRPPPAVSTPPQTSNKLKAAIKPKPEIATTPPSASQSSSVRHRSRKSKGQRLEANLEKIRNIRKDEAISPVKREHKIVHSPNVREVTTLETPSGTITLTPTKKMAKTMSAAKRKALSTTLPVGVSPAKRSRSAVKSPTITPPAPGGRNRSSSPLPKAAYKGRLPKIRVTRKPIDGASDGKWRIEHVFQSKVTDAEIDCTPILDRRSRKRSDMKMTPPPLQRAPATTSVPTPPALSVISDTKSSAARILPTLSPAPSSNSSDLKSDLDLAPTHQPVRLKIRLSRNNNRPTQTSTQSSALRSTPRKAKSQVKYTVDSWWDEN